MPIFMGSTPTIKVIISTDEVDWNTLSKVFLTFSQKDEVITSLNTTFTKGGSPAPVLNGDGKTFLCQKSLTQAQTLALKKDVDLDCQVDVLTTDSPAKRKVSKIFSFGVCSVLRNETLT